MKIAHSGPLMAAIALMLAGCSQYAVVSEVRPRFRPVRDLSHAAIAQVEHCFERGTRMENSAPMQALGEYLYAADLAAAVLKKAPRDVDALNAYNFALSRVFTTLRRARLDPWSQPLVVTSEKETYVVTNRPPRRKIGDPRLYEYVPAIDFDVRGTYVHERTIKAGLGAPLVAEGRDQRHDAAEQYAPTRTVYGVTAVAHFDEQPATSGARRVMIAFEDPLATENVTMGGQTFPLAADFTVPLAVMLARENPKKMEIARVLRPEKYAQTAHITRLQPYDPEKTVVIVTHGLMDSPATWTPMINALRGDPFIRDHFQFWFYSYPSGYPYPYSAAIMRRELDGIERRFPIKKPIVLIGHSMGSLISRLMITDSGDTIWLKTFGKPPSQLSLHPETKKMLEETLIFRHRPEVGRVIFISGPHRGSELASNWIGRLASGLVKAPVTLVKTANEVRSAIVEDSTALHLRGVPNSVDTLAPNNRFVKLINTIPITAGIPYHSIMGDRGKGGNKDKTQPVSSDGIVPYWSSHLEGAESELIVPSNHSAHQNPQAIAEVSRILRLHGRAQSRLVSTDK